MSNHQKLLLFLKEHADKIPLAVYVTELHAGTFHYSNDQFRETFNVVTTASRLYPTNERPKWVQAVENARGSVHTHDGFYYNKENELIRVRDLSRVINPQEAVKYVLGVVVDLSREFHEKCTLESRVNAFKAILNLDWVNVGYHRLECLERCIIEMNAFERELLSIPADWVTSKPSVEILSLPNLRDEVRDRVDRKFQELEPLTNGEHRTFLKPTSQTTVPVNIQDFAIVDGGGKRLEIITAVRQEIVPPDIGKLLIDFGPRNPLLAQSRICSFVKTYRKDARRENEKVPIACLEAGNPHDLVFIFGNDAFCQELIDRKRIFQPEDLLGKVDGDLFPEDGHDYHTTDVEIMRLGVADQRIEPHRFPSGFAKVFKCPFKIQESDQEFACIYGFYWDVRDDRPGGIADELRKHCEPWKLLDDIPVCVFRKDEKLRFTYVNRAYCDDNQRSRLKVIGRTDEDIFPHELASKYKVDDERIRSLRVGEFEILREPHYLTTNPNGIPRRVEVRKTRIEQGIQGVYWYLDEWERTQSCWIDFRAMKIHVGTNVISVNPQKHLMLQEFELLLDSKDKLVPYKALRDKKNTSQQRFSRMKVTLQALGLEDLFTFENVKGEGYILRDRK